MSNRETGSLSLYVKRIMEEKGLSVRDVQLKSGRKITGSYVNSIVNGTAKNPSIEKLKALAMGLGVNEDEIFNGARGVSQKLATQSQAREKLNSLVLLDLRKKIVLSPDVTEIIEEVLRLSSEERLIVLKAARSLNHTKRRPQQKN